MVNAKKTSLNRLFYYLNEKFMIESFLNDFIDAPADTWLLPEKGWADITSPFG